ncbi:MAG: McrB family protein [Poseidonibacter sp.]|uniref:McrB family protein n=1 Tax=Poseidonibacter sp. TaxID=2321188 RepID=UPI00359CBDFA
MREDELILKLKDMYLNAADKKQVSTIHLFGIQYKDELKNKKLKNIAKEATGKESYYAEINKGMNLSILLENNNLLKKDNNKLMTDNNRRFKSKNIMLYGAPGVGKTHNYKKLISMIENGNSEQDIFKSIKTNENTTDEFNDVFNIINNEKRIQFVTFHQSYSYEDFIEGFRPNEDGNIELEDGIFKLICDKARNQIKEVKHKYISFDEAFEIFRSKYIENELDKIYSVSNIEIEIHEFKEKTIRVQSKNAKDSQYVKKNDLEKVVEGIINNIVNKPSDIKSLDVKKDTISLGGLYYPFGKIIQKIIENNQKLVEEKEENFYIVIDEINRGNISKIFGELITLIEEDKRDEYEVTLPYSKEKFKIPSNLFIIATMNSTDKSIATIDIALRRRFTFLKMKPNEDLVINSDAKVLMHTLNKFIEEKIGDDYKLGHSYFMKINNDEDLEFIKEYKLKPLLEEYFYADDDNYKKVLKLLEKDENE